MAMLAASLPVSGAITPTFAEGQAVGTVTANDLWEASGLVASRQNPGVLWSHNDSGLRGTLFALATNGAVLGRYSIPSVTAGDFEDIAIGPGPIAGIDYLYLGDIGDNYTNRPSIRVFRFPEPAVYPYFSNAPVTRLVAGVQEIELQYPDGPQNAEALLVDPRTGDLFIATKHTNYARIYRATRAELTLGGPVRLSFMREITFKSVSAGDVSPDGSLVMLRRNNRISAWVRQPGQSVSDALAGNPINTPVIGQPEEPNGEGLAFAADNGGYYTISEGTQPVIYFFRRTDEGRPPPPRVLVGPGEVWRYQDFGLDLGREWRTAEYDDSWWAAGPAQLGYGQDDEATTVFIGPHDLEKNPTIYFRKTFNGTPGPPLTNLIMRICYNDGVAVYWNGVEVLRRHLAAEADFAALASADRGLWQNVWVTVPVPAGLLQAGPNLLAVETHRRALDGPDLSFDLQLLEGTTELPPRIVGLPRLEQQECRLNLTGPVGELVWVETTDDLRNWRRAGSVILTNGAGLYREVLTNAPLRLFRLSP